MNRDTVVLKFGGTSVASKACWDNIIAIVTAHIQAGKRPLLVCSAVAGVSNQLTAVADACRAGQDWQTLLEPVSQQMRALATDCQVDWQTTCADLDAAMQATAQQLATSPADAFLVAELLSFGERLLTQLAAIHLTQHGLSCDWIDARDILRSIGQGDEKTQALSANVKAQRNDTLIAQLQNSDSACSITQGFIAKHARYNRTVCLGRGGSDTSVALMGVAADATCCEIWTDVPGIFTANPQQFPNARQLTHLSYAEAMEMGMMGASVLHPNTIPPVAAHHIPLSIKCSKHPTASGTTISESDNAAAIKAVNCKNNVIVVAIEGLGMWQQYGFLATIFEIFKQHHLSVDLISTSQSNVTVSLDSNTDKVSQQQIHALQQDLEKHASVRIIQPCATISIVGNHIRQILHKLGPLFDVFRSQSIHLLSQSANNLNLAVVVAQSQAQRIVQLIHDHIIEQSINHPCFGQRYAAPTTQKTQQSWWQRDRQAIIQHAQQRTPCYLYDEQTLRTQAAGLLGLQHCSRIFYAMKANPQPHILQLFERLGLDFECVSIAEIQHVLASCPNLSAKRILFTPNFASEQDYRQARALGVNLNVDNAYPLQHWQDCFQGADILLRIDPGFADGHHRFVETGGTQSKFGIPIDDVPAVKQAIAQCGAQVIGLHAHTGSGILRADNWARVATQLSALREHFPTATIFNLGGGLGIPEKPAQQALNLAELDASLAQIKQQHHDIQLWLEPGRFLVAQSGIICATVTQLKKKGAIHYIGVDAGMHTLIRPALYGAYHLITNLSRQEEPEEILAHIVGPICETGDVLGYARWMPKTEVGDIILIANTGAYGACMASQYNSHALPEESFLNITQEAATCC